MNQVVKALETIVLEKLKSLNKDTSPEDVAILHELMRVDLILKSHKMLNDTWLGTIFNQQLSDKGKQTSAPAAKATNAEEWKKKYEMIKCATTLTSKELRNVENHTIALQLYFLVANGAEEKGFMDFYEIGNVFGSIAANLKR